MSGDIRRWRERNGDAARRIRARQQIRTKALRRLAVRHAEEFQVLYDEELALAGEPPCRGPGRRLPKQEDGQR